MRGSEEADWAGSEMKRKGLGRMRNLETYGLLTWLFG